MFLFLLSEASVSAQSTDVLTYHNDNGRTGQALHEEVLTPANVNSAHFGKLWVLSVDGKVDAQPLYAAGVVIPGQGERNVVFVATEHDSVYAFDADRTNMFWQVSVLGTGETPSDDRGCTQVTPEIGITATPVIDRQLGTNGTIFVVAMSKDGSGTISSGYMRWIWRPAQTVLPRRQLAPRIPARATTESARMSSLTRRRSRKGQVCFC